MQQTCALEEETGKVAWRRGRRKPAGPAGHRGYVIGDVHGRLDLLEDLLKMIEADDLDRAEASSVIVFLGDLIDRGPQSAQVVERLIGYSSERKCFFLMGNHEEVMLRVLGGELDLLREWLKFGGKECLHSYGLNAEELRRMDASSALEVIRSAVPEEHVAFLESFADSISFGDYLFVHAGVRPRVPLADQRPEDLRWIRSSFLEYSGDHGMVVVHGHTISQTVEVHQNRIGIDTGAYMTGMLTALGIDGTERWLLQTGHDAFQNGPQNLLDPA